VPGGLQPLANEGPLRKCPQTIVISVIAVMVVRKPLIYQVSTITVNMTKS
jgi:hypothetical protein